MITNGLRSCQRRHRIAVLPHRHPWHEVPCPAGHRDARQTERQKQRRGHEWSSAVESCLILLQEDFVERREDGVLRRFGLSFSDAEAGLHVCLARGIELGDDVREKHDS